MKRDALISVGILIVVVAAFVWYLTSSDGSDGGGDIPDGDGGFGLDTLYAGTVGGIVALVSSQTVGPDGISLIQGQEGCQLTAYPDAGGYSIGYGHHDTSAGATCTQAQADAWLQSDASSAANTVLKYCRVALSQNQLDALTDWVYNLGATKIKNATLWSVLNGGNYAGVPDQLMRWVYSGGVESDVLTARRQAECDLWNQSGSANGSTDDSDSDSDSDSDDEGDSN